LKCDEFEVWASGSDPFGRRIEKTTSSATSSYAYDSNNLVEETNASGAVVARYAQGLNIDEPVAMLRASATSYYEHFVEQRCGRVGADLHIRLVRKANGVERLADNPF
jgi:hypothetical protein